MALVENKELTIKNCKNYIVENGYFVGFTGKRALCYDNDFNLISSIDKLKYVYYGDISPDGKNILLTSTGNTFSIHRFPDFELIYKSNIKAPYNGNLEGNACWSFDSEKVLLCATNDDTINSTFKIFNLNQCVFEEELLKEKYWLTHIMRINEKKKYLLIGFNRKDLKTYLIWFDGNKFSEHCLMGCDDIITSVKYNSFDDSIDICCNKSIMHYDCSGNQLKNNLSKIPEFKNAETVTDICVSKDNSIAYIGSLSGFYVLDMKSKKIMEEVNIEYGVHKISEISKNKIIVSTWNGVRSFEYD